MTKVPALIGRRQVLALGSWLFAQPILAQAALPDFSSHLFLSAASDSNEQHWVTGFTLTDNIVNIRFTLPLPARAHHIAVHEQSGLFVAVARRPGNYLHIGDLRSGNILQEITLPGDRHLLGHGIFSKDGRSFYALESSYQNLHGDNGRLVRWQVERSEHEASFTRQEDFPSYGTGPHELLLMPDQETLVIANGGIRTHPDSGRKKLNIDTMQASLVYIDANNGKLLEQHKFTEEYHQSSIRHLDINAQGRVALVMQYEGEPFDAIPLVATHRRGEEVQFLNAPEEIQLQMKQYVGSVKYDKSGRYIAASCPRGNLITFWDVESASYIDSIRSRDGCGVYGTDSGFIFSAGTGRIDHYNLSSQELVSFELAKLDRKIFWDNHLS